MKNFICIFILFCISSYSLAANFNGEWKGQGYTISGDGKWRTECNSISISIVQNNDEITISQLNVACDQLDYSWDQTTFVVKDRVLYSEGKQVGVLAENSFSIVASTESKNSVINFTANAQGQLFYQEQISDVSKNGLGYLSINGILTK